jgi:hypothetical protein
VTDEAKKPKNDENDYYGPEHGYVFPLSWFKRRITTDFREQIKQKLDYKNSDLRSWVAWDNRTRPMEQIYTLALFG